MPQWFHNLITPLSTDELKAHREHLLNVTTVTMGALSLLGALIAGLVYLSGAESALLWLILSGALAFLCALAFGLGRRGWTLLAGYVPALAAWAGATYVLALGGWYTVAVVGYVLGVAIAVILTGWPGGGILSAISVLAYWVTGEMFFQGRLLDLFPQPGSMLMVNTLALGGVLALVSALVHVSVCRLDAAAEHKVAAAQRDARDLDRVVREHEELIAQLQDKARQQEGLLAAVSETSVPVLPIAEGLIVMPLVGHLDLLRAERLLDDVLAGIVTYGADRILLDLTGMLDIGSSVAQCLRRVIQGARLLGSECILVGIQPAVACELVALDIDLEEVTSYGTLQEGLAEILQDHALSGSGLSRVEV